MTRIVPSLWFDGDAEDAVNFYVSLFPNSRVTRESRYGEAAAKAAGKKPGQVLVMGFELDGRPFIAINGGPMFKFTEALSLTILCDTQADIDRYWTRLTDGGAESRCGWLKDRYGLSWQVVPSGLSEWMTGSPERANRVMSALLQMNKLDIATLRRAAEEE